MSRCPRGPRLCLPVCDADYSLQARWQPLSRASKDLGVQVPFTSAASLLLLPPPIPYLQLQFPKHTCSEAFPHLCSQSLRPTYLPLGARPDWTGSVTELSVWGPRHLVTLLKAVPWACPYGLGTPDPLR